MWPRWLEHAGRCASTLFSARLVQTSHPLESANLFISCFMKFERKGIHPADHYWKAAKANVVSHVCRSPTSRFAEGTDICLASPEESLTLDTPVLSIPEFPQREPKVVDTRRCLSNIPPNPELALKSNIRKIWPQFLRHGHFNNRFSGGASVLRPDVPELGATEVKCLLQLKGS